MQSVRATVTRIIDGDTFVCTFHAHVFDLHLDLKEQHIRIKDINTPELDGESKIEGLEAKLFMEELILNQDVQIESDGHRSFHRLVADVYFNEKSLADILAESGQGVRVHY